MFPVRDDNPIRHAPVATWTLIALNGLSWAFVQGLGHEASLARSLCLYGLIPGDLLRLAPPGTLTPLGPDAVCRLDGQSSAWTLLTSMFLHGGWFHLIGNLWFLKIFGDNVEDVLGPLRFVVFYLACGLVAAGAQIASSPASTIPMVGASGAIGGVMGAYARLFPRAHVQVLLVLGLFVTTVSVPAIVMLGYWFALQLLGGIPALSGMGGGVAFWAHIGGFVAGVLAAGPLRRSGAVPRHGIDGRL